MRFYGRFLGYEEVKNRRERGRILREFQKRFEPVPGATIDNCSISKSESGGKAIFYDPFWRTPVWAT